ncbi:MAG TPA: hypothetical protein VFE52_01390, partial [Devosia sp.]|nr:hypothetical protein [Devosia sp.]
HLLVGDEALAGTAAFARLREAQDRAVRALREGEDAGARIAECLHLAEEVDPRLAPFYRLLPERADDFPPVPKAVQPA